MHCLGSFSTLRVRFTLKKNHLVSISSGRPTFPSEPGTSTALVAHTEPGTSTALVAHTEPGTTTALVAHTEPGTTTAEPSSSTVKHTSLVRYRPANVQPSPLIPNTQIVLDDLLEFEDETDPVDINDITVSDIEVFNMIPEHLYSQTPQVVAPKTVKPQTVAPHNTLYSAHFHGNVTININK